MNHRERFLAHFNGVVPDRTPMFLRDFTLGLDNLGVRTTDLVSERYDSELASRSVISFGKMTGQDAIVGCVHTPAFIVEQFGGKMKYPEYGIPSVTENPLSLPGSLDRADTAIKGKALDAVESYHITAKADHDMAVVGNITGPLTKASVLMGMDALSMAIAENPQFVKDVIDIGNEATFNFVEMIEDDIDLVFLASASDNPGLFGNDVFDDITVPYVKQYTERMHRMGKPVMFHPHGDFTVPDLIESVISTGVDGFQFAEQNGPCKICRNIRDRCVVMGGTDIVPTLYSGTKEEIIASTERYLNSCSPRRYIFSCSCSLQRGVPLENIRIMAETVLKNQ